MKKKELFCSKMSMFIVRHHEGNCKSIPFSSPAAKGAASVKISWLEIMGCGMVKPQRHAQLRHSPRRVLYCVKKLTLSTDKHINLSSAP